MKANQMRRNLGFAFIRAFVAIQRIVLLTSRRSAICKSPSPFLIEFTFFLY
jgi:hypothetical protein